MLHREQHRAEHIGWLRAAVKGANDGTVSTASLVLGVAAAGMAGMLALFLPFAFDESPVSAVAGREFWRLAFPFFMAVPVSLGYIRWIITGRLSRAERVFGYLAGGLSACVTLSLYFGASRPSGIRDWISMVVPLVALAAGGLILWRNRRTDSMNPLVAMQAAYLAHSLLCLISFAGEWQSGAYVTLLPTLYYIAQVTAAHRRTVEMAQSPAGASGTDIGSGPP